MSGTVMSARDLNTDLLRLLIWSPNGPSGFQELATYGFRLMAELGAAGGQSLRSADVALIDICDWDWSMVADSIQDFRRAGLAVVVVVGSSDARRDFVFVGADVVGSRDCSLSALSLLIRSAFRSVCIRRELEEQVSALKRKLDETKLIAHAKAIVAERLGISEADAFRNLRREARNRRRSLNEIAQIVVASHEMMSSIGSKPATAPLAQRVSRVKTAPSKPAVPKMQNPCASFSTAVLGNNAIPSQS